MSPKSSPKKTSPKKVAVIVGAGPAGLTAAYELLTRTDIIPIVLEKSSVIGGLSATYQHKGNSIDIGGHRFFSKSDKVIDWWLNFLPLESSADAEEITYRGQKKTLSAAAKRKTSANDRDVMLMRDRKSSIVYQKKMFDYPLSYSLETVQKLGVWKMVKVGATYLHRLLMPIRPEESLEDLYINRFGDEFYKTFFQTYTEKVWGKTCKELSAEWGRQRVKGLSISRLLYLELIKRLMPWKADSEQETSLIEKFMYPSYGPGQLWETVAKRVQELGGEVILNADVTQIENNGTVVKSVSYIQKKAETKIHGDYFFSTMPINELFAAFSEKPSAKLMNIASNLEYRDFITVGIAVSPENVQSAFKNGNKVIKDNWLYIHDRDVKVGRIQLFNNWSPYLVADRKQLWLGLEYFCFKGDDFWNQSDNETIEQAVAELLALGFIKRSSYISGKVIRVEKAYPSYSGTYKNFPLLRKYLDTFENLFLIGRNGMHKYNNQDHSMLTAMEAVSNIIEKKKTKENIWSVNTEQEYHEKK